MEYITDHCRIGSLEMISDFHKCAPRDHCRIGSLEMADVVMRIHAERSLPHRQLRKLPAEAAVPYR